MRAIRKVTLGEHHLRPGRTRHFIGFGEGRREFPPFTSLAITRYPGNSGFYLMHLCEDGQGTDTWHASLDDAFHQAEYEFGVRPDEWTEVDEAF